VYRQAVTASVEQRLQAPDVDKQSVLTSARAPPPPKKKPRAFAPTIDFEQSLCLV
jgi:hypothetical protein